MRTTTWLFGMVWMLATPALATEFTPAKLVDLRAAPVSPSQLTDGKKEDAAVLLLRAAQREKVTASDGFDALLIRQKARDAALITIIGPDSALTKTLAKALKEKFGTFLTANAAPQSADAIALQMVQSIFLNRRDDLTSVQNLYGDAAWKKALQARLQKSEVPELNVTLNADKRAELKNTALYVHTPGKAEGKIEPAVHIFMASLGNQIGHEAIAEVTKPGSPVHALFLESIAKALPNDPAAKDWLNEWLYLREGRARAVTEDFRPDGALMQEAVAQSEAVRRARLKNPPAVSYE